MRKQITKVIAMSLTGAMLVGSGVAFAAEEPTTTAQAPATILKSDTLDLGIGTETAKAGISVSLASYYDDAENTKAGIAKLLGTTKTSASEVKDKVSQYFKNVAIAHSGTYVNVRKKASTKAGITGMIYNGCGAKILEKKSGWLKVQSGNVTGWVKADLFLTGAKAQKYAAKNGYIIATVTKDGVKLQSDKKEKSQTVKKLKKGDKYVVRSIDTTWAKLESSENYGYVTAKDVKISDSLPEGKTKAEAKAAEAASKAAQEAAEAAAQAAQATAETQTDYTEASTEAQTEASTEAYTEAYTEAFTTAYTQAYTEAYTQATQQATDAQTQAAATQAATRATQKATAAITQAATQAATRATQQATKATQAATKATQQATKKYNTTSSSAKGQQIVNYAMQFIGNPYVYGGSSLTNGTDCSGFTMSVYAHFGYSISRSSSTQRYDGRQIPVSQAQPGDIICFNGHVALYAGNGMIVHAADENHGIVYTSIGWCYQKPLFAVRVI